MLQQNCINKNKMINVFSFQKIITHDSSQTKNISKTLHHVLNYHQKKMLNQSKVSLDFRKVFTKHHQPKKNFTKEREDDKRIIPNPLEETSSSASNIQSLLYNKAFKIRCYSKRISKEQESENQLSTIIMMKSKTKIELEKLPKVKDLPSLKQPQKQNILRMQQYSCPQNIREITLGLKIHYNKQYKNSQQEIPDESSLREIQSARVLNIQIKRCSILINVCELAGIAKIQSSKMGEKDKSTQFFIRRVIITLKKTIQSKFHYQKQISSKYDLPQIIFKASNNQEYILMKNILAQCQFSFFHCLFYIQYKHVQSSSIYDLTQINQLRQNIIIIDSFDNFKHHPPFLSGNQRVTFCAISDKANIVTTFQKIFSSSLIVCSTSNGFQKFIFTNKKYGVIIQFPLGKFTEKLKQKKAYMQKVQRQLRAKNQNQNLLENTQTQSEPRKGPEQNSLGRFKQKMLMYLKIVQKDSIQDTKKQRNSWPSANEQFQCVLGRQLNSKTNIQLVSELVKLNSNIQKQIASYQRQTQNLQFLPDETEVDDFETKFSNQMFVNILS